MQQEIKMSVGNVSHKFINRVKTISWCLYCCCVQIYSLRAYCGRHKIFFFIFVELKIWVGCHKKENTKLQFSQNGLKLWSNLTQVLPLYGSKSNVLNSALSFQNRWLVSYRQIQNQTIDNVAEMQNTIFQNRFFFFSTNSFIWLVLGIVDEWVRKFVKCFRF